MSNNFIATKVRIQFGRNLECWDKAYEKLALLGFACGSACAVGQTPNVPMWASIKLFFKMCYLKNFKTIWVGLNVGKVRSFCVKEQRNCLPSYGRQLVIVVLCACW